MIEVLKQALEALENIMFERDLDSATTIAKNARYALRQAIEEANTNLTAYMFQHNETGRITFVDIQQIENGWEKGNPRYTKLAPLYTHPPQRMMCRSYDPDEAVAKTEAKLKERNS